MELHSVLEQADVGNYRCGISYVFSDRPSHNNSMTPRPSAIVRFAHMTTIAAASRASRKPLGFDAGRESSLGRWRDGSAKNRCSPAVTWAHSPRIVHLALGRRPTSAVKHPAQLGACYGRSGQSPRICTDKRCDPIGVQTPLDYEIGLNVYSPLVDLACEAVPHALHSDCLQCLLEVLISRRGAPLSPSGG